MVLGMVAGLGLSQATAQGSPGVSLPAPATPAAMRQRLEVEFNPDALLRTAKDLAATHPERCKLAADFESKLAGYRARLPQIREGLVSKDPAHVEAACRAAEDILAFGRAILLTNPLLDFDQILVLRRRFPEARARSVMSAELGFPGANFYNLTSVPRTAWDNEIAVLSHLRDQPRLERLFQAEPGRIVRDLVLDYDAKRLAFSSRGPNDRWALSEIRRDGTGLRRLTPNDTCPDVDFFGPCYLPDGKMLLSSNASLQGLPCVNGNDLIANLYLLDPATKALRQLAFDQDSDAYPTVLNDGRVMFLRWEYSDIPHYFSRRLMSMNPDGTGQLALYGSNSMFPTTFLFAKPVPGHPSMVVGVIGGHHDVSECGRLALLDPGLARNYPFRFRPKSKEWGTPGSVMDNVPDILPAAKTGFIQTLPGFGLPVAARVCDSANTLAYAKEISSVFAHPYPLSDKYFLAAMKPNPGALWGIYLVDSFDNQTLLAEVEGEALLEPIPFKASPRPPVIPNRVQPDSKVADVHIADIYTGPGLQGVPRGTVKNIRVFSYHFAHFGRGGHDSVGVQSSWDVKRILGEATVEPDGSAFFQIPANTPVSLQPLDAEGRAVQLMRSWLVGMPGEHISCSGCHEDRGTVPQGRMLADSRPAEALKTGKDGPRPFAFAYEVYPVIERYCIDCHRHPVQLRSHVMPGFKDPKSAYDLLHPYIHRPGPESDSALLVPMEYHASTSRLIQMLESGHHGVQLASMDATARQQLYRWIDLNVPWRGAWEPAPEQASRRLELARQFSNIEADPEAEYRKAMAAFQVRPVSAVASRAVDQPVVPDNLRAPAAPAASGATREIDLGNGRKMGFVQIPAGAFVMGSIEGQSNEYPRALVKIDKSFWMGVTEVTNGEFAGFDPGHDTRYLDVHGKDHSIPGFIANHPDQPVARVSWQEALRFCEWLGRKAGLKAALPTEAQWEWAARGGTETPFFYGTLDTDFSPFANLADQGLRWSATSWQGPSLLQKLEPYPPEMNFPLHDERFNDKTFVVDYVGQKRANVWGLKDMVGNVSEWTLSSHRPYPYVEGDGRNNGDVHEPKVARGGSWADRPVNAAASMRRAYESWQKVYDVGLRVILEE